MGIVQRQGLLNTIAAYTGVVIGFVNKVLLFPTLLATEQVGLVNALTQLSVIFAQVASLGFGNVLLRYFPFFNRREGRDDGLLTVTLLVTLIGFVVVTVVFLLLKPLVVPYFPKAPLLIEYYAYLIPLAATMLWQLIFESYLRSLLRTVAPTISRDIFLRLAGTLSISLFAFGWIDFKQFVQIYVTLNVLVVLGLMGYVAWIGELRIQVQFSRRVRRLSRSLLVYGGYAMLGNAAVMLLTTVDVVMIMALLGEAENGIYTTLVYVLVVTQIPARAMGKVILPMIAELWKRKALSEMGVLYKSASMVILVSGLFIIVGIIANLGNLFKPHGFLPPQYAAGTAVVIILSLGRIVDFATSLNGMILVTSKKYRIDLRFNLFLVGLAILTNALLIPRFGLDGAAWATTITFILFHLGRTYYVHHAFGLQPFSPKMIIVLVIGGVALGTGYVVPRFESVYLDLLVRSAVVTVIYGVLCLKLRVSDEINAYVLKVANRVGLERLVTPLM